MFIDVGNRVKVTAELIRMLGFSSSSLSHETKSAVCGEIFRRLHDITQTGYYGEWSPCAARHDGLAGTGGYKR